MRQLKTAATLIGLAMSASLVLAAPAWAGGKLHLIEHATTDAVIDTGAKGDSAGDLLTFANDVFAADNTTKMGTDNGYCIRTVVGKAWECFWTLSLGKGQVTVEGPFYDAADSSLAITGGTGAYAGVRGEMGLHARDAKGSEYDFIYVMK